MAEKKTPDISRYTFDTAESIFKDFEPYHCGIPAITEGFIDFELDPEKCDETNNFQSFKANGYTEEALTNKTINKINNNYKSNEHVIKGCKRGTVILGDHPDHDAFIAKGSTDATIKVTGTGNNKKITITGYSNPFNVSYFTAKGLVFPKRLGIMLVGGGGGAGGGSWYDAKKDGKKDDRFYCSGGSGGGGCVLWGVINIEELTTVTIKTKTLRDWFIKTMVEEDGKTQEAAEKWVKQFTDAQLEELLEMYEHLPWPAGPGWGGKNAGTSGLTHNSPNKGQNGYCGYDTILYFGDKVIATAHGGGGGRAGHWENTAGGGYGGDAVCDSAYFKGALKLIGLPGIDTKKNMDPVSIPARDFKFEFMTDNTENGDYSYKTGLLESRQTKLATDTTARVPGGHSLGSGAYQDTVAGYGGGGCSNGSSGSNNGGSGYWIIFYA